ncbi:MAG: M61 family metallopeptidase, partial [Phycisphaerae bacterium]
DAMMYTLLPLLLAGQAAGPPIEYTVSLAAPQTQMVEITVRLRNVNTEALDLALPVWRPGRYVVLDPAGTIRRVRAVSGTGAVLPITKIDKTTWRVTTRGASEVRVAYEVYANALGDRTRHVDDSHAFLSGSAVFLYARQRRADPVLVHIDAPDDWRVASGLESVPGAPRTLTAANYDVLVDSPLEIGEHDVLRFDVEGVPHEIVVWGSAAYDGERLTTDFAKIVAACGAVFGDLPYRRYVFILHVGGGARGATEHLNSTVIQTSRKSLEDPKAYKRFLGVVSHEMFHTWNVKRLRPAGMYPYDYARENYTKLLWVAEGTTSYYDGLLLVRAGLRKPKKFLDNLGKAIDKLRRRPGRLVQSLEASSFDAWIKFNKPTPDSPNSTVSFYDKGALVSLLLDLEIRSHTDNGVTLDDVMRTMYERFPLARGGYTPRGLLATINELAGHDFDRFFERYVRGTEPLDFATALEAVGLELYFKPTKPDDDEDDDDAEEDDDGNDQRKRNDRDENGDDVGDGAGSRDRDAGGRGPGIPTGDQEQGAGQPGADKANDNEPRTKAYLGLRLSDRGGKTNVRSVSADGPAYRAGVIVGDEIVALDGRRLPAGELDDRLKRFDPGDTVRLTIFRRDMLRTIEVVLAGRPDGNWRVRRIDEPTELQRTTYASWLQQPWPEPSTTRDDKETRGQQDRTTGNANGD